MSTFYGRLRGLGLRSFFGPRSLPLLMLASLALLPWPGMARACPGLDEPCRITLGEYRILLPKSAPAAGKSPIMLHLHGFGGSADGVLRSDFSQTFLSHGFAVIAPQGLVSPTQKYPDWAVRDGETHPRDDVAFIRAVLDDATGRFVLDKKNVLLTGFSRGASMVWDIACISPDTARGYAPVSGGFWAPFPFDCAGPVRLLHTHGFSDMTVPLEGRPLQGGVMTQADIFQGLELWRRVDGCGARAGAHDVTGPIWRKIWTDCHVGTLELALHSGPHGIPEGWADMAIEWFDGLPPGPLARKE